MELEVLRCPSCGAEGKLRREEQNNLVLWHCAYCGGKFLDESAEREAARLLDTINSAVGSAIDEAFLREKTEKYYNLRVMLWDAIHAEHIDSKRIAEICYDIKKIDPHDFLAEFFELANTASDAAVSEYVNNIDTEKNELFIDLVIDFLIRSMRSEYIIPTNLLIERAYRNKDLERLEKYMTALEAEVVKVSADVYETKVPRDVFIAYSSKDISTVVELIGALEDSGITCFAAFRNLQHGRDAVENYERYLKEAIDNCKIVVFVSSENSRSFKCDAFDKELTYVKQCDVAANPMYRNNYEAMPNRLRKPRVEYRLDNKASMGADMFIKEFFAGLDYCETLEKVVARVIKLRQQLCDMEKSDEDDRIHKDINDQKRIIKEFLINNLYPNRFVIENGILKSHSGDDPKVIIPDGVVEIAEYAFRFSNIVTVFIPDSVKVINDRAFEGCSLLNSVTLGKGLQKIGTDVFSNCRKIVEVVNNSSLDIVAGTKEHGEIALNALEVHTGESKLDFYDDFVFYTREYMAYLVGYLGSETTVKLPELYNYSTYEVYKSAFCESGKKIQTLIVSDGVEKIGSAAFMGCKSLSEVSIGNNVIEIDLLAFSGCRNLQKVNFGERFSYLRGGAFENCVNIRSISLPIGVAVIGEFAFSNCSNLESVNLYEDIVRIGEKAFDSCPKLMNVYFNGTKQKWKEIVPTRDQIALNKNAVINCLDGKVKRGIFGGW